MAEQKRAHRATYSRDNKKGGYLIRVQGPHANKFAGKEVPVTRMDNSEENETLKKLIWAGKDNETGQPVALYEFEAKPKGETEEIVF